MGIIIHKPGIRSWPGSVRLIQPPNVWDFPWICAIPLHFLCVHVVFHICCSNSGELPRWIIVPLVSDLSFCPCFQKKSWTKARIIPTLHEWNVQTPSNFRIFPVETCSIISMYIYIYLWSTRTNIYLYTLYTIYIYIYIY